MEVVVFPTYRWTWSCSGNRSLLSLLLPLIIFFQTSAVNPGCRCVRYTSTWGKEWALFSSPDYPAEYPRPIRCLLYSFSAPPGFIVHLNFERIGLPPPSTSLASSNNNGCTDFLKLFIHVEEVHGGHGHHGVNENTPWTRLLCGNSGNLSYHSSSRHLIIQFHASESLSPGNPSSSPPGAPYSFVGRYRFLNSSQFVSTGRLMTGTKCDYQFVGRDEESGRFFSPHYPSTYPYNVRCAYHFYASLHKRVRIVFETVALQAGDYSCLNKTDVIRVLDGSNPNAPVIALICNSAENFEVLSSGPHAQVEFLANSDNPGSGFRGTYHYVEVQLDNSWDNSRLLSSDLLNGQDGLPQASTLVPQCNQVITSDAGRNGSFSSPNYPHYYTPKTQCRYVFLGHGKERVQIHFTDFSLFHPSDGNSSPTTNNNYLSPNQISNEQVWTNRRCTGADVLSVWIHAHGHLEKVVELCGHNVPPQIMSNGHRLTLELHSIASANFARGFHATYAFVEDFGIKTGRQLEDYPCGFVYNSSERQEGTFWSPNYPGSYPRDTECHFFFYGLVNFERVLLTFNSFHLSGSKSSCEDYIELSNFMGVDRMYTRRCGTGKEKESFTILSKSHFFRVTFRSSGASRSSPVSLTSFHGSYRFTSEEMEDPPSSNDDDVDEILTPTTSSSSSTRRTPTTPTSRLLLLFLVLTVMVVSLSTPTTSTPLVIRRHILLLMAQILEK